MKITIVTAVWNGAKTIRDAMASVARQRFGSGKCELGVRKESDSNIPPSSFKLPTSLEYIVVDGGSTDGTVELVREFELGIRNEGRAGFSFKWISERDKGLYDALNKGIRMATGDVVGICNADDVLAGDDVVAQLAERFEPRGNGERVDCVYGDVRFVDGGVKGEGDRVEALRKASVMRYCTGRFFRRWMFRFATFPAHPSTFVRREWFERAGWYSLDYRICADFEFMLRLFCKCRVKARYAPLCTHVMRAGGMSTGGVRSNVQINREDLRALKANGYWACLPMMYLKYPFKIFGILFRNLYAR